jgi:uncharacterized protein (TIGR00730 family)
MLKKICVYCGSSDKVSQRYLDEGYRVGKILAEKRIALVYGGGKTGVMGSVANGALEHGGKVIGVTPTFFNTKVLVHPHLTRLEVVEDMHQRKALMISLADGFIALPGGYGTFDELFEVITWAQIGLHAKPIGLFNIENYFGPFIHLVEHAIQQGFIYDTHRELFIDDEDIYSLLEKMEFYKPPKDLARWVQRNEYCILED